MGWFAALTTDWRDGESSPCSASMHTMTMMGGVIWRFENEAGVRSSGCCCVLACTGYRFGVRGAAVSALRACASPRATPAGSRGSRREAETQRQRQCNGSVQSQCDIGPRDESDPRHIAVLQRFLEWAALSVATRHSLLLGTAFGDKRQWLHCYGGETAILTTNKGFARRPEEFQG